jgi:hypothetical protein
MTPPDLLVACVEPGTTVLRSWRQDHENLLTELPTD